MSIENLDLNINNYELNDLLNLFKLDINFSEEDLKLCYKTVLKLHPDKSGLDKDYFLFYTKAFKMLKNIFEYKNKKNCVLDERKSKIEYLDNDKNDEGKKLLVEKLKNKKTSEFNKWFNETFEKFNIDNNSNNGYGEWLRNTEEINDTKISSVNQMHQKINKQKKELSQLVKHGEIKELSFIGNNNELDTNTPESYTSTLFSKLQYDDLKVAHTETVIPVCDNDYNNMKKFNNIGALQDFRNRQNIKPMSKIEAEKQLTNNYNELDKKNTELAYRLSVQAEKAETANNKFWNSIRSLK